MSLLIDPQVREKIEQLKIPFNRFGFDRFGISKSHLEYFFSLLHYFYKDYFRVRTYGIENIPQEGRVMLIGNHSGGIPIDGGMILVSLLMEMKTPRLAQGMVEKFANRMPFVSSWFSRVGQLTGLPEHAQQLLEADRVLMVFPEGARGTAKLQHQQYSLVRFGTGFMRLAMKTQSPIVPVAFVGGGDAFPTMLNLKKIGAMFGLPYLPVTRHILPIPLSKPCELYFGEPLFFEGNGDEEDEFIEKNVQIVKDKVAALIAMGVERREHEFLDLKSF